MSRNACVLVLVVFIVVALPATRAAAKSVNIETTKHNLSKTGPGDIKAWTEDRICVFCHTPHNANPRAPLWNKNIDAISYSAYPLYWSTTMASPKVLTGPTGASRLCLSCHDGTIALGEVVRPTDKIAMNVPAGIPATSRSYFGTSLASHHPISFSYYDATANPEINATPPDTLLFYNNAVIQCTTCHDPHDNTNKKFLAVNADFSGLCILCHSMTGWLAASHNSSSSGWNGLEDNPWPRTSGSGPWDLHWTTVAQNGCENCHSPHSAGGMERLLNSAAEEQNCYPCHNGNVASKNIKAQFNYLSRHYKAGYTGLHDPRETLPVTTEHVECVDCHNPHASNSVTSPSVPGGVSGITTKVAGVDKNGVLPLAEATYEYEICFKCHAETSTLVPVVNRVISTTKADIQFNTINPSYHPVVGMGQHPLPSDVPSIPSLTDLEVPPGLTVSSIMYCTDCHSDEVVTGNVLMSRGPHGSPYAPILRRQYLTADTGTPYNDSNFGLCYRCHDKGSLLANASFRTNISGFGGHAGHLTSTGSPVTQVNAPCSVCHDPHGVQDNMNGAGPTGSHSYLINFDTQNVTAYPGYSYPLFTPGMGAHSGSCTLVCHGVQHDGSATYSYP